MTPIDRRQFLKRGTLAAGAAVALAPHARVLGANDDVRVAVVGFRSQGRNHIQWMRGLPGVRVVALCDADRDVLNREMNEFKKRNEKVEGYTDIRKLLENKNVDAISTATPDHWHCLVTIWACQAGKDVYVEKPLSHNIFEGGQVVEAARKYNRIVQWGNQNHSHPTGDMVLEKDGVGKIRVAYTSLHRGRNSIGKVKGPQPVPDSVDYDLWTGPAPLEPLHRKTFHYDWHWVWPTGTGEIGNNGIYQLNDCRLSLGQKTLPKRAMSIGGRFLFGDDGTTPNTQIAIYEYEPGPTVIFELRNMDNKDGPELAGRWVQGDQGRSGFPGWSGKRGDTGEFSGHQGHMYNFIKAVRSRNVADLRAPIIEGHWSTSLVHMANISYRLGTKSNGEEIRERVQDCGEAAVETFERFRAHLEANGLDWTKTEAVLGPWLEMDDQRKEFVGATDSFLVPWANRLARGEYREPFVVPEKV